MESVEAEGNSIDAAIENALQLLGTTRERVEIAILSNAARGLLGFGARKARVRATLRRPVAPAEPISAATPKPAAARRAGSTRPRIAAPADDETAERARTLLRDIVEHVGVDANVEITNDDEHTVLELTGDSSGVLIGRRGQMLDALEYVLNRIILKDQSDAARIVVDSQNYRARRRESLEQMARRMGAQAKKRRRPVTLNPMSPRDRRIVHLVLQDDPSLTTRSSGKGYYRKLVIIPEGASKGPRSDD